MKTEIVIVEPSGDFRDDCRSAARRAYGADVTGSINIETEGSSMSYDAMGKPILGDSSSKTYTITVYWGTINPRGRFYRRGQVFCDGDGKFTVTRF